MRSAARPFTFRPRVPVSPPAGRSSSSMRTIAPPRGAARLVAWLPAAALLAPAGVFLLATIIMLGMGLAGHHPFWRVEDVTLSEAAGTRDDAQALRLIMGGADPNGRYPVR